ncbi:hypothetical protein ACX0MU_07370 [Rhizorhabdus wittichii]
MTQAEYAAHRGVRPSAVSNWKKAGLLVFAEDADRPGKLFVDVVRTDAKVNARIDPVRGAPRSGSAGSPAPAPVALGDGGSNDLTKVRLDLVRQQTVGQALKNEQAAGQLVPLVEMQRRATELGRTARERMHAMARDIAERLSAETEIRTIVALLGAAIDEVFTELADQVERGALAEDEDDGDDVPIENEVVPTSEVA